MASNPSSFDEMLASEKRAHAIQIAVLDDREFIEGALKGLSDELSGNPGKLWRELKAELRVGEFRG